MMENQFSTSFPEKTINDLIYIQSRKYNEKPFLISEIDSKEITYFEVDVFTKQVAGHLKGLGISKGDVVGILLDNCIEFPLLYLGVLRMGAVALPLNISLKTRDIKKLLIHSGAKVLFGYSRTMDDLLQTDDGLPQVHCQSVESLNFLSTESIYPTYGDDIGTPAFPEVSYDDVAEILYTSGTTGRPKGVMLSHRNLMVNASDIAKTLRLGDERFMCILPLCHTNGQIINLLAPFMAGGSVVLCEAFSMFSMAKFWQTIDRFKVNIVDVVPSVLSILLRLKLKQKWDTESLKYIICGAAPLPLGLQKSFEERFGHNIVQEYGLTEGTCVSSIDNIGSRRAGSVGRALENNAIRIVDDKGENVAIGDMGEVIIHGDNVMLGYYDEPEFTRETIRGEWLYTGDLGKLDDDGYLFILDRKKDIIIKSGENIYPTDIENILIKHPEIAECAVVGIPHEIEGECPKAYVVLVERAKITAEEIIQFCREYLPNRWCPESIEVVSSLPRTASGKVRKRELKDLP